MSSDEMGIIPTRRLSPDTTTTTLNPQLLFQDDNPQLRFRGFGDSGPKSAFMGDRCFFPDPRRSGGIVYGEASERRGPSSSEEEDEEEEEDEDDEESEGDGDGEIEGAVGVDNGSGKNAHSGDSGAIGDRFSGAGYSKNHALFGSSTRLFITKDGGLLPPGEHANRVSSSENGLEGRVGHLQKMVRIAEHDGDMYYSQLIHGTEGSSQFQKDIAGDNGCGFSGRKNGSVCGDPGEPLRAIFSDPITGALMDDAVILPCGHSFGGGGIQQVIKMKACHTCSHSVSEDSIAPNLSLRVAVQAFRREEDMHIYRASKRRREILEQEKGNYGDSSILDTPRGRGVQFPFVVTDRVIIKGNKRTPLRFVGREAIVTTQCLNGWYVVKTVDNAECVKLQYRSLEKVPENPTSSKILMDHKITVSLL